MTFQTLSEWLESHVGHRVSAGQLAGLERTHRTVCDDCRVAFVIPAVSALRAPTLTEAEGSEVFL